MKTATHSGELSSHNTSRSPLTRPLAPSSLATWKAVSASLR